MRTTGPAKPQEDGKDAIDDAADCVRQWWEAVSHGQWY
jgi:hypothetical protein